jgi:streptomycin 6-kinase
MEEVDLGHARQRAEEAAARWGLELGEPFSLSRFSYVAPAGDDAVVKVAWEGDDESLHEPEAFELWDGDGAVRVLRRDQHWGALLEERALPGTDISALPADEALAIAVELGLKLWQPAGKPFRWIGDHVPRWLDNAERKPDSETDKGLLALAREVYTELDVGRNWLVHGDFHHHNILRHGDRHVAIDPKPYLADREFDVPTFLWNPLDYQLTDRARTEHEIRVFVDGGLDEHKIRAWTVIRGAYLGHAGREAAVIRSLLS